MRKVIFYIGIAGLLIGVIMLIAGYLTFDKRDSFVDYKYLLGYGFLTIVVSGIVTFISKIFINQRG